MDLEYIYFSDITIIQIQFNMTNQNNSKTTNTATQFSSNDIFYEEEDQPQFFGTFSVEPNRPKEMGPEHTNITPEEENSLSKQAKENKKCLNHNFQKHTVTTVKKLMRMKYVSEGSSEEKLAYKIWNIFMVSDIKSKKILVVLFGAISKRDQRDISLFRKCGFEEILSQEQGLIRNAQELLRMRFIETVTEEIVWQNIRNFRSIKQCEEFYVYFAELLRIIRSGPLLKFRINDKTSKKIREEIKSKQIF